MITRTPLIYPVRYLLGWLSSSTLLFVGCSVLQLPDYPIQPADQYRYTMVQEGLAIAIHPVLEKQESQQYFGIDLLSLNTLAVFVTAENRSPSSSFIIAKEDFSLGGGEPGGKSEPDRSRIGSDAAAQGVQIGAAVAIVVAPVAALVLLPVGVKMASVAGMIHHNFATKELQVQTLSPGKSVHGFVYFRLPEKAQGLDRWVVHVEAQERPSNAVKSFDFSFTWARR